MDWMRLKQNQAPSAVVRILTLGKRALVTLK
jgi:hypothetical protein